MDSAGRLCGERFLQTRSKGLHQTSVLVLARLYPRNKTKDEIRRNRLEFLQKTNATLSKRAQRVGHFGGRCFDKYLAWCILLRRFDFSRT